MSALFAALFDCRCVLPVFFCVFVVVCVFCSWHPWSLNKQVAGYAVEFSVPDAQAGSSFNFITVHDSGHMVPQYQPARALEMLHRFVNDQKF